MQLRIHENLIFTADALRLRVYEIADDRTLSLRAERSEPTELNAFTPEPAGERLSRVAEGRIARSITVPGQSGHWAGQRSTVVVYDLALHEITRFEADRLDDRSLALSPDATRVASIHRGRGVVVFDVESGALLEQFDGSIGSGVSWSSDGRWIAAGDTDQGPGELYLLDMHDLGGDFRRALPAPASRPPLFDSPYDSVFTRDGRRVAFSCAAWGAEGVTLYDVESGTEIWGHRLSMPEPEDGEEEEFWDCMELDLAAADQVVLAGVRAGTLHAWRADDGTALTPLTCPDSDGLFFAVDERRHCIWYSRLGEPTAIDWPADWR